MLAPKIETELDLVLTPRKFPATCGDAERIRQVMTNPVGNAIKFTLTGISRSTWVRVTGRGAGCGFLW
jgi:signal transduction histidine kinase